MKKLKYQAINLNDSFRENSDITNREKAMLNDIVNLTGFVPGENIWRSQYWGKNLGASHWLGELDGIEAVLKIQGVKPDTSEISTIMEFDRQNRSSLIRTPKIYKTLPWSQDKGYEAILMESVTGQKVLEDKKIQSRENISVFLDYYKEYRKNCIPNNPWLPKPPKKNWARESLDNLTSSSLKAYPNHPFRLVSDFDLAKNAYGILEKVYNNVDFEFLHGHFSCNDLKYENKKSKKAVLFSNLFWKWRFPYFDSVFAHHWFIYELNHVNGITPSEIEEQRKIWFREVSRVIGADRSTKIESLLNAALLERAIAGLLIDSFLIDPKKPIAKYLTGSTRSEVERLVLLLTK